VAPDKLFEPFASGRPGGLGLGLYQARKSLREAGGGLSASVVEQQLCFVLQLPQSAQVGEGGVNISDTQNKTS
jgi:signal transduction histidine kinase